MRTRIEKVAVLGSGVMGSGIAAHFTNVGIPCLLLDIPAKDGDDPDAIAAKGLDTAKKAKPAAFYTKEYSSLIEVGNFDKDMARIGECDLVIEVIVERMDIKKDLFRKVDEARKPGTIIATNTSGLSVNEMSKDCSDDFRKHFIGMHFFNPPRYLKLLELIPTESTGADVVDFVREFGENVLGKGVILCKDTPSFVANRIGAYIMSHCFKTMVDDGHTIQEVDAFTGTNIGHAKSATFRTADVVGIDIFAHVSENLHQDLKNDDEVDIFEVPDFMKKLVESKALGVKTGKGFYLKTKDREIKHLDYKTGEYLAKEKLKFDSIAQARKQDTAEGKFKAMVETGDKASDFLWKVFSDTFLYCVKRMGEIADSLLDIDCAMKWGWGHQLGPFEKIDALGVAKVVERLKKEGKKIPEAVETFLAKGNTSFYKSEGADDLYYDFVSGEYKKIERDPKVLILKSIKERSKTILTNSGASLVDLGDGVACLEFHSKMNAVGTDIISMTGKALDEVEKNYAGLVVGNQAQSAFSAGANLMLLLMNVMEEEWDDVDLIIRSFQKANMRMRYSPKPVVIAPFGLALGGGCEIAMHGDLAVAAAETYIGLVEAGAGLIPAGGGSKEMILRAMDRVPPNAIAIPFLQKVFETIAMAKVATSAIEAREMGFLRDSDMVVINGDHQLHYAKQAVLGMARSGYTMPRPRTDILVAGRPGMAALKVVVNGMVEGRFISEHDAVVALKLGSILTGGDLTSAQPVSEQYLLDLEREAFLSLCGMRKTQERMKYILEKGKPLRN